MKSLIVLSTLLLSFQALSASFRSSISFSSAEKAKHKASISTLLNSSSNCLKVSHSQHLNDLKTYGISRYYGDQSKFAKKSYAKRLRYLKRQRKIKKQAVQFRAKMIPVSCVGFTLLCLEKGFKDAGQMSIWNKVKAYTKTNRQDGTALQNALQKLGWDLYYWNPDVSKNVKWDKREKKKDFFLSGTAKGYHTVRYNNIKRRNRYYKNTIDNKTTLVNFGMSPPRSLNNIPFVVATAHTGYHVFPATYGRVFESHGTAGPKEARLIEDGQFNPLEEKSKEFAPKGRYKSGLIAVPPTYKL